MKEEEYMSVKEVSNSEGKKLNEKQTLSKGQRWTRWNNYIRIKTFGEIVREEMEIRIHVPQGQIALKFKNKHEQKI